MANDHNSHPYQLPGLENVNRQLLENQSFLFNENQKLQDDVSKLSQQLENLKKSTVSPQIFESLRKEKDHLLALNQTLKVKIKNLKSTPSPLSNHDFEREQQEKAEILKTIQDLDQLIEKVREEEKLQIHVTEENVGKTVDSLTKKLEEQERKWEEANETIRKLREDDEKYVLKERINDMKQLVTDLEVENTKLKFETEQLTEDVENYKKQLSESSEEAKEASKKYYHAEDEKDKLKNIISQLENEKIQLKKDMIEEMNEANRAKRVSVDTEIALQHISEAYESKRQEVKALHVQLEDAEKIIRDFKRQFNLENKTLE